MKFTRLIITLSIATLTISLISCTKTISVDQVQRLDRYTNRNKMYQYHYLSIPDSATLTNLIEITEQLAGKNRTNDNWAVYNYYLHKQPNQKYATLMAARSKTGNDTIALLQYKQEASPLTRAIDAMNKSMETDTYHTFPDSCVGIWANWANPFLPYTIIYRQNQKYTIYSYHPSMGGDKIPAVKDSTTVRKFLQTREGTDIYRYEITRYGDLYITEERSQSGEYLFAIANFICDCKNKQAWQ